MCELCMVCAPILEKLVVEFLELDFSLIYGLWPDKSQLMLEGNIGSFKSPEKRIFFQILALASKIGHVCFFWRFEDTIISFWD